MLPLVDEVLTIKLHLKARKMKNVTLQGSFLKGPWGPIFLQATLPALVCFSIRYCKPQEKRAGAND